MTPKHAVKILSLRRKHAERMLLAGRLAPAKTQGYVTGWWRVEEEALGLALELLWAKIDIEVENGIS